MTYLFFLRSITSLHIISVFVCNFVISILMSFILSASDDPPFGNNCCFILVRSATRRIIKTIIVAETPIMALISLMVIDACTNQGHNLNLRPNHHLPVLHIHNLLTHNLSFQKPDNRSFRVIL